MELERVGTNREGSSPQLFGVLGALGLDLPVVALTVAAFCGMQECGPPLTSSTLTHPQA